MRKDFVKYINSDDLLLKDFNNKCESAFTYFYQTYFRYFHVYATKLYQNTEIDPKDVVQDIFLYVWERKSLQFNSIASIRAYLFLMIKSRHKNYIDSIQSKQRYINIQQIDCNHTAEVDNSRLDELIAHLKEPNSTIIRMYLDGWSLEDIALKLNYSIRTIYNKKNTIVSFLKSVFSDEIK